MLKREPQSSHTDVHPTRRSWKRVLHWARGRRRREGKEGRYGLLHFIWWHGARKIRGGGVEGETSMPSWARSLASFCAVSSSLACLLLPIFGGESCEAPSREEGVLLFFSFFLSGWTKDRRRREEGEKNPSPDLVFLLPSFLPETQKNVSLSLPPSLSSSASFSMHARRRDATDDAKQSGEEEGREEGIRFLRF